MRPQLQAFLADSKEQPEDDAPRLILADWLEEHGLPGEAERAEFIRVQVALARLAADDSQRPALAARERALRQQHGAAWLGPLAARVGAHLYRRGLPHLTIDVGALTSPSLAALAGEEVWAWVEGVEVQGATHAHAPRLAACALLETLGSLGFSGSEIGPGGLEALAGAPALRRLARLDLTGNAVGNRGVRALAASPNLAGLVELILTTNELTPEAGEQLAGAGHLGRLRSLCLWNNRLGDGGARALARAAGLAKLAQLDLRANGIGDGGAVALARTSSLTALTELNLADNRIGPRGALALAEAPGLGTLKALVLWGNPVGPEGVEALRQRFGDRVHVSPVQS
jgi:uncharacterized protein (TIGR02996 family)